MEMKENFCLVIREKRYTNNLCAPHIISLFTIKYLYNLCADKLMMYCRFLIIFQVDKTTHVPYRQVRKTVMNDCISQEKRKIDLNSVFDLKSLGSNVR